MAGDICNTTVYDSSNPETFDQCRSMFTEQIQWAVEEDMPTVFTMAPTDVVTYDGTPLPKAMRIFEEMGADVVGLSCHRGPETMLPLMKEIRKECKGPIACLPAAYRTSVKDGLTMMNLRDSATGLLERLKDGETIVCAEGYLFEFEKRGYLKAGAFVPEVVVEHPHLVKALHEEFVHCGSDVVQAFTFYGNRQKLKIIGRENEVEKFNRQALKLAREVADATGTLMAGNICNITIYDPDQPETFEQCRSMFTEQVQWAVEEGADFIIGETFGALGEAKIALECIKKICPKMPTVFNMAPAAEVTNDGVPLAQALRALEELGADVVGLNCHRGPDTTLPLMRDIRKECKGPLACLPVAYRTSEKDGLSMQNLRDTITGKHAFPRELDAWLVSNSHIEKMTKEMQEIGIQFMGVCCGNRAQFIRTMCETLGRRPPASRYSMDMSQHMSQIKGKQYEFTVKDWHNTYDELGPLQA